MKITKKQLKRIIRETIEGSMQSPSKIRLQLIEDQYDEDLRDAKVSYPYGRYRGDERRTRSFVRKDGQPISDEDFEIFKSIDGNYGGLGGGYRHELSRDGTKVYSYYSIHSPG